MHLWQQFHQKPLNECPDLFDILSDLEQTEQQFIIVLNHLDVMGNADVDARFNQGFYERLNSLKNYRHVALLIMTQVRYDKMLFNIEGEFKTSKLDIRLLNIVFSDWPIVLIEKISELFKKRKD
ncbi:hypothetical protein [Candidatus Marithrix sp. Canyon 246]|uniref:hypothetical protein n=1 Tax=Candidatus Marithrix sp. Canyon 246 TaxID=1827136 RepID=UPI00084A0C6F|nr:hypothetical protein [Candidatus Marithrix sp. Canyon 246]